MRRSIWAAAALIVLIALLAGCGSKKDAGTVTKDLERLANKMESYKSAGRMVLHTGLEPQEYQVEVWHQKPHYYKISLTNRQKDVTQIVLRNDDGVFVLTPHLNKSFRFQSNWPDNQGQVYLYQTLVQSIVKDEDRQFTEVEDSYVFDVKANYQNATLARQKIWLDKKTYAPQHVEVSDANANIVVVVDFNEFQFDAKFDDDSFDMQRSLTGWNVTSQPASSPSAPDNDPSEHQELVIMMPEYRPEGVGQPEISDITLGDEPAVMMRYSGTYNYTLVESRPQDREASVLPGKGIDLGFTVGVLAGEDQRTLTWMYDGMAFRLSSADLPEQEMIRIAQSVQGQIGK